MRLTVIGQYGPYPKAGNHASSCYLVTQSDTALVLDMGPGTLSRLAEQIEIQKITAVFISHLHYDHTSDLLPFRYLLEDLNCKVTIYAQTDDTPWCKLLFDHPLFEVISVTSESRASVGDFELSFFDMKHTVPCLAVKIKGDKTLLYTGDTLYNDNIPKALAGADCVLADCSKPLDFEGPHMNVGDAKRINRETGIKIISTHLSPDYDPTPEYKGCPDIVVARENTVYEI